MQVMRLASLVYFTFLLLSVACSTQSPELTAAEDDPVIVAAGDIACSPTNNHFNGGLGDNTNNCRQLNTSNLVLAANPEAALALGDNQYDCGSYEAYLQSYDLSWGRFKSITKPAVGNHEYLTSGDPDCTAANDGAAGYYRYFGSAAGDPSQGYYSFDVGTWHIIALNTQCRSAGGCSINSPQGQWLQADLAAHTNYCTLAYWHIPLFSSGGRANNNSRAFWEMLYAGNADLILTGHDHTYERFAPQASDGTLDERRGIREFVVGTGGSNPTSFVSVEPNSEVRNDETAGILKLTLHPTSYDWEFIPEAGKTFTDSGSTDCHSPETAELPAKPSAPCCEALP
jgi:Calcineurin-like phosphoesterase